MTPPREYTCAPYGVIRLGKPVERSRFDDARARAAAELAAKPIRRNPLR